MLKNTKVKEDRSEGFYWVEIERGEWVVALWDDEKKWFLPGIEWGIREEELLTIGRRIER